MAGVRKSKPRTRKPKGPYIDSVDGRWSEYPDILCDDDAPLRTGGSRFQKAFENAKMRGRPGIYTTPKKNTWGLFFGSSTAPFAYDNLLCPTSVRIDPVRPNRIEVQFRGHRKCAVAQSRFAFELHGHFWYGRLPLGERLGLKTVRLDNGYFPIVHELVTLDLDPVKAGAIVGASYYYDPYSGPGHGDHMLRTGEVTGVKLFREVEGTEISDIVEWVAASSGPRYNRAYTAASITKAEIVTGGDWDGYVRKPSNLEAIDSKTLTDYLAY